MLIICYMRSWQRGTLPALASTSSTSASTHSTASRHVHLLPRSVNSDLQLCDSDTSHANADIYLLLPKLRRPVHISDMPAVGISGTYELGQMVDWTTCWEQLGQDLYLIAARQGFEPVTTESPFQ